MRIIPVYTSWTPLWIFRRVEKKLPYPVPEGSCHIFSFSLIIFSTSCSVMGLRYSSIQYCFERVGSWIHRFDQEPQYEYWPSYFIRDAELKANRPGDMKYCVFVCMMNLQSLIDTCSAGIIKSGMASAHGINSLYFECIVSWIPAGSINMKKILTHGIVVVLLLSCMAAVSGSKFYHGRRIRFNELFRERAGWE